MDARDKWKLGSDVPYTRFQGLKVIGGCIGNHVAWLRMAPIHTAASKGPLREHVDKERLATHKKS